MWKTRRSCNSRPQRRFHVAHPSLWPARAVAWSWLRLWASPKLVRHLFQQIIKMKTCRLSWEKLEQRWPSVKCTRIIWPFWAFMQSDVNVTKDNLLFTPRKIFRKFCQFKKKPGPLRRLKSPCSWQLRFWRWQQIFITSTHSVFKI